METIAHTCPHCEAEVEKQKETEEFNFAVMLALLPLVVMTFFTQVGLL